MTLLMNTVIRKEQPAVIQTESFVRTDDHSYMPEVFDSVLKKSDQTINGKLDWHNDHTVEVSGIPAPTLHDFVLKAEELGKHVSFEKKLIIKIQ